MSFSILTIADVLAALPRSAGTAGRHLVEKAYTVAARAHSGQKRKSGEDYINHPLHVAKILAQMGMDAQTVAAGLLHDVPEDTSVTIEGIKREFGPEIAAMVDGITKLSKVRLETEASRKEYALENLRKMFFAMAADIRVVIIKLADRLHNMRTLESVRPEKQQRIASETREIFVPIADRLGIGEIRDELQDLAFRYLEPEAYVFTARLLQDNQQKFEEAAKVTVATTKEILRAAGIAYIDVHGRVKKLYSLYKKLQKKEMDITRIYDLVAVRVIVKDVAACYESLGAIHRVYRPMIGRIKDYISLPKSNGYQSLHTTVFGPGGQIVEFQIRTQQMHDEAEFGIAAHWLYKERGHSSGWRQYIPHFPFSRSKEKTMTPEEQKRLAWVRQLQQWQKDVAGDSEEFWRGLTIDFFRNHIFAFTPRGDTIDLPEGATPIDFAYAVHSAIGDHAVGARVDGKMVALDTPITNGQVVEILTDKNRKCPNRDWLVFAQTSTARCHIRAALRKNHCEL